MTLVFAAPMIYHIVKARTVTAKQIGFLFSKITLTEGDCDYLIDRLTVSNLIIQCCHGPTIHKSFTRVARSKSRNI